MPKRHATRLAFRTTPPPALPCVAGDGAATPPAGRSPGSERPRRDGHGTLTRPWSGRSDAGGFAVLAVAAALTLTGGLGEAVAANVCDRTVQVRDAIEAASGGARCASLTLHHLREITALDLSDEGVATLRAGDFDGLVRLDTLDLSDNLLTSLPSGVFDELYLLKTLRLNGNQLTALPDGIFDELFLLEELTLHGNRFTSLPADLFDDFSRFAGVGADGAAPDNSGKYPRISRFLTRHSVTSPETFIAALPPLYRKRFALMFRSGSPAAPHVSGEHPRVISWGADGEFIFSWNTDPDAPSGFRDSVEFLRQDETAWTAGVIDFSGAAAEITEPASCQSCHGALGKPLWGEWNAWEGSEYVLPNSDLAYPEAPEFMREAVRSTDARIEPLDFEASSFEGSPNLRVLNLPGQVPHLYVVVEAGAVWSWRHAEVLFGALSQRQADLHELGEATMCDARPRFPVLQRFDHGEHNLAVSADVEVTVDSHGRIVSPRSFSVARSGYFYNLPGSIPGAVNFLIFADLWERDEMVRHLVRNTPNDRTLPDNITYGYAMLHYPSGSATAEDELIQKLRLHFGRGRLPALKARGSQNARVYLGGVNSANFWEGHLVPMRSRICSALRDSAPRSLSAAATGGDVQLSWESPTYDPSALTGYRILRSAGGGSPEVLVADTDSTGTSWTDESPGAGVHEYAVRALYDDLYASRASAGARVTVGDVSGTAAPSVSGSTTFTVAEGATAVGTLTATDTDSPASAFTWSITGGADQAKFAITAAGALSFQAAKDYEAPDDTGSDGSYAVTVQVSDGAQTGTADLTVTLSNVNEAPTANAGTDQTEIAEGATVTLSGSGTDPDAGDTLSYAWTKTAGPAVTLSGADTATATFTAPSDLTADAVFTFKLTVTDAGSLSATDTVSVTVEAPERAAPAVTGTTAFTVAEGATAVGTLTATDTDTDADDLTWSITGGADQAKFAVTTAGVLSFKAAKDYESPDDTGATGATR